MKIFWRNKGREAPLRAATQLLRGGDLNRSVGLEDRGRPRACQNRPAVCQCAEPWLAVWRHSRL